MVAGPDGTSVDFMVMFKGLWDGKGKSLQQTQCKEKLNQPKNHYKYIDTCCCGITYKRHRISNFRSYRCPKCQQNLFVEKKDIVVYRDVKNRG